MNGHANEPVTRAGDWGAVTVHPLGACVMSWQPDGLERLYVASDAEPAPGTMWHGGIPVCAPWFGVGQGDWQVPQTHGLVSRVAWELLVDEPTATGWYLLWRTDAAATAHLPGADHFPPDLSYTLGVTANAEELKLELGVTSPSTAISLDEAFHTYLAAQQPTLVEGLIGLRYHDYATDIDGIDEAALNIDHYLDRVYRGAPDTTLSSGTGTLRLSSENAASTVVWNPGPGSGAVPGEQWRDFVCIEYGNVQNRAVTVPAGGTHTLTLRLNVE